MKILVIPSWYPSRSYPNNGIFFKEQAEAFKHNNCEVEILSIEIPYRKMKILVIPSWYPSRSYPNNGIFFKEQAEAFKHNNCEVEILSIEIPYRKTKKDYKYFIKNEYIENGIHIYRYVFPVGILHRFPKMYYSFLNVVGKYIYNKEFKNRGNYVIHAHSFGIGGYIGVCIKKKFGVKCIITEHSSKILKQQLNKIERKILKKCVCESDEFVCVSENLKNSVVKLTGEDCIRVYPNMVSNIFRFEKKRIKPFSIVSIGNLIYGKLWGVEKNMIL